MVVEEYNLNEREKCDDADKCQFSANLAPLTICITLKLVPHKQKF